MGSALDKRHTKKYDSLLTIVSFHEGVVLSPAAHRFLSNWVKHLH